MISPPAKVLSRSDLDAIVTKLSRPHTNSDRDREDLQREDKCEGVGYECMSSVRKGFQENFGTEGKTWRKDKVDDLEQLLTIRDA